MDKNVKLNMIYLNTVPVPNQMFLHHSHHHQP